MTILEEYEEGRAINQVKRSIRDFLDCPDIYRLRCVFTDIDSLIMLQCRAVDKNGNLTIHRSRVIGKLITSGEFNELKDEGVTAMYKRFSNLRNGSSHRPDYWASDLYGYLLSEIFLLMSLWLEETITHMITRVTIPGVISDEDITAIIKKGFTVCKEYNT